MRTDELHRFLVSPAPTLDRLAAWGLTNLRRGYENLLRMAASGIPLDLLAAICERLAECLPRTSDPDMALNNLERFVSAARSPLALAALFERDPGALPILAQIFSTSQHLSDVLIADPPGYDLLRMTEGQPVRRDLLVAELASEVDALADDSSVLAALRRFKRRETLRISYGDTIRGQRLDTVAAQISYVADAVIEAALRIARRKLEANRGRPQLADGRPARFVALGMGKLGGVELNYSSDIDLILLYEGDGQTDGPRPWSNAEFFGHLAREMVRLMAENTQLGIAYRVDLRLRPEGERGPVVHSVEQAQQYYDVLGRTWERQAYVKARPVAGDLDLGKEFLAALEPWIYGRYLGLADIAGIKALKRRIEQRAEREGVDGRNVKTGRGGIRDIEFVIQFLQLLNGGDLPAVRTGNTLEAIARLARTGCLVDRERGLLEENYAFLRKIEHRLQIMFDLQTHLIPEDAEEVRKLAIRLGYSDSRPLGARAEFEADYRAKTAVNRRILDHLLHDAFGDDAQADPDADLVLDPDPSAERIQQVLDRYNFRDVPLAYQNLMALSAERIRFLSTRRCRHFLAAIAPRLLKAIAATPDPDGTLVNLAKVSDSLGGKGLLWELFSFNPPSMNLYVELCATSQFLSGLLISNPGMLDELMDSLVLNKLPSRRQLQATLAEQARSAEDLEPILHAFKNTQQLRVGVRDILGKQDIQATIGTLSDIAEVCLALIAETEYQKLTAKLGPPTVGEGPRAGQQSRPAILAMGKFGGRELSYHSDLDIVFLFEADGPTSPAKRKLAPTNNQHFYSEWGQRIIKLASRLGPFGRLYDVDPRLRPTGKSGALATTLGEFSRYFAAGDGQLWERQALCKARVVYGDPEVVEQAEMAVALAAFGPAWQPENARAIWDMRRRMEEGATANNLKRAPGGMVDIEFLVQMLQLKFGPGDPSVRNVSTLGGLAALAAAGRISKDDSQTLSDNYRILRTAESRLRLISTTGRNTLPDDPLELTRMARMLGFAGRAELIAECRARMQENRARCERLFIG